MNKRNHSFEILICPKEYNKSQIIIFSIQILTAILCKVDICPVWIISPGSIFCNYKIK